MFVRIRNLYRLTAGVHLRAFTTWVAEVYSFNVPDERHIMAKEKKKKKKTKKKTKKKKKKKIDR